MERDTERSRRGLPRGAWRRATPLLAFAALALQACEPQGSTDSAAVPDPSEPRAAAEAPATASADPVEEAVSPLPPEEREAATVLGYDVEGALVVLREGDGRFICLADDPEETRFHVACYHDSLEPYMSRGRELKAEGLSDREAIARRWEEIEAGTLAFPDAPAALYSFHAEGREALSSSGEAPRRLTVLYVRGATAESTGLPTSPEAGLPWLMMPGSPTAHVMIHD